LTPGTYHLGISGAIYAPFDAAGGRLFQNLIGPNVATPLAGAGPLDHFAETYPANSEGNYRIDVAMTPLAVPEPATSVLLGLGIAAVNASAWRRHRRDGRS
jgi:hypothetical protein